MNERVEEATLPRRGWGIAIALGLVALVVGALAFASRVSDLAVPSFIDRYGALVMGAALGFGLTGAAIVSARPEHRMGWLMTTIGTALAITLFLQEYAIVAIHEPDSGLFGGGWALALASAVDQTAFDAAVTTWLGSNGDDMPYFQGTLRVLYLYAAAGKFRPEL